MSVGATALLINIPHNCTILRISPLCFFGLGVGGKAEWPTLSCCLMLDSSIAALSLVQSHNPRLWHSGSNAKWPSLNFLKRTAVHVH